MGVIVDIDGVVYVAGDSDKLFAVGPDGKERWQIDTGEAPYGIALGMDGTMYVALQGDNLAGKLTAWR